MKETIVYHNPKCSKSREVIKLLTDNNIEFKMRLYLEDSPSVAELNSLLQQLELQVPDKLIRDKEQLYKDLDLASKTTAEKIELMANNPKLIERPVVTYNNKAKIGRPPESIMQLFI